MDKEQLKQEYEYWVRTIENVKNCVSSKPKKCEELVEYNFARGFVSAVDKSGIFEQAERVEELEKELEEMTEDRNMYRSNSLDWQGEDEED